MGKNIVRFMSLIGFFVLISAHADNTGTATDSKTVETNAQNSKTGDPVQQAGVSARNLSSTKSSAESTPSNEDSQQQEKSSKKSLDSAKDTEAFVK